MARAFQTVAAGDPNPPAKTSTASNSPVFAGQTITVLAGDLTLNKLLGNIVVPKGAEILSVMLDATDLDTGGSPAITLAIGDVDDDDRLLAANTIAQTGAAVVGPTIAKTGFGYRYAADTLISVKVTAAPATAAGGTIKYGVTYISQ